MHTGTTLLLWKVTTIYDVRSVLYTTNYVAYEEVTDTGRNKKVERESEVDIHLTTYSCRILSKSCRKDHSSRARHGVKRQRRDIYPNPASELSSNVVGWYITHPELSTLKYPHTSGVERKLSSLIVPLVGCAPPRVRKGRTRAKGKGRSN